MEPTNPTLGEQLATYAAGTPAPIAARVEAGIALTAAAGPFGIPIGAAADPFALPNAAGVPVALADVLRDGPVVLTFYRGDWCPFCNLELRSLQAHLGQIRALGATVLAVSPQAPDHGTALTAAHELGFDVLSDLDQSVIAAYRLLFELDDDTRDLYANVFGTDLAVQNADGTWRLPVPATFVLDRDGVVRDRHVDPDFRTRMEPTAIIDALRRLP